MTTDTTTRGRNRTHTQLNRTIGTPALFDPEQGAPIVEPPGTGPGWWAGAPGVCYVDGHFYMIYRLRQPQPVRGGETCVAVSSDGTSFETIWRTSKEAFDSPSIERSALVCNDDGRWRLYISYVDGADGRWRIDQIEADSPAEFDPATRTPVLHAAGIGAEGVKDPWICRVAGIWHLIVSYAPTPPQLPDDPSALHATRDVYNTGYTRSLTGLATSLDSVHWQWHGPILEPPTSGWDQYTTRINAAIWSPPVWVGFYDGAASVAENYEERCGLAYSFDLRTWHRASIAGPAIGARQGPGSVRYVEAVQTAGWTRYFYEYTRPDGSHDLRTCLVEQPS